MFYLECIKQSFLVHFQFKQATQFGDFQFKEITLSKVTTKWKLLKYIRFSALLKPAVIVLGYAENIHKNNHEVVCFNCAEIPPIQGANSFCYFHEF